MGKTPNRFSTKGEKKSNIPAKESAKILFNASPITYRRAYQVFVSANRLQHATDLCYTGNIGTSLQKKQFFRKQKE